MGEGEGEYGGGRGRVWGRERRMDRKRGREKEA